MIRVVFLVLPVLLMLVQPCHAQQTTQQGMSDSALEPVQNTSVDKVHQATTDLFRRLVEKVDYFFQDDDYQEFGENPSRLRLRFNVGWVEHHGWDEKLKVRLRLVLPGLNKRLQLIAGDNGGDDEAITADEDGNDVALRWVGLKNEKVSVLSDVGLRLKSGDLDPYLRLNTGIIYDISENWYGNTSNRLYYYSKTHWRIDFRQSFNRPITDDLLFRSRTRIQYFDENDFNPFLEQKFSLFHTLNPKSAIAYEALWQKRAVEDSVFDEDEIEGKLEDSYQNVGFRFRYRRNVWRPWLYVEVWPAFGWAEERDWDTVYAVNFRLEVTFGGKGKGRLSD